MFGVTTIHPIALGFTLLMCGAVVALPRRAALLPFLLLGVLVTEMQRIVILGLDFTMLRLLLLAALARILFRNEHVGLTHRDLDTAVLAFAAIGFVAPVLLHGTREVTVYELGLAYNALGIYFTMRCFIRDEKDVVRSLSFFSFVCALLAASMLVEQLTGRNLFSIFGGVPAFTPIRDGKLRSQGAFPHPLLAGAFGGTLLPVFTWVWRHGTRWIGAVGLVSSVVIALSSASSGPLLALISGMAALLAWTARAHMRSLRRIFVLLVAALQLAMKAPVYALVGRLALYQSSTGYHRYALIDQAVKRLGEWWLLGTVSTAGWGWGLWDVTNQYIAVGVGGGVAALSAFVAMIVLAFRNVGDAVRAPLPEPTRRLIWAFGATLFSHCVVFWGMAYFGAQIYVNWYFTIGALALAPSLAPALQGERAALPTPLVPRTETP